VEDKFKSERIPFLTMTRINILKVYYDKVHREGPGPLVTEEDIKRVYPKATKREIRGAMKEFVYKQPRTGWALFEVKGGTSGAKPGTWILWRPTEEEVKRHRWLWIPPSEEEEGVPSREEGLFAAFPFLGGERMVGIFKGKERLRSAFEKSRSLKVGTRIMPAGGFLRLPPVEEESYAMFPFLGGKMRGKNPLREALQRKQSKIMEILRKH